MSNAVVNDSIDVYIDKYNEWLNEIWDLFTFISMCTKWSQPPINDDYYSEFKQFDIYEICIAVKSILPQGWWHNKKHSIEDQKKQVKYLKDLLNAKIKHVARHYKNSEGNSICGKPYKEEYKDYLKEYNKHLRVLSYIENEIDLVISGSLSLDNDENEKENSIKFLKDFIELTNEQSEMVEDMQ